LQARLALVEAWRAAAAHPAASDGQRAQALIGAGEHLSALGFHAEAKAAFEDAASLSEDPLVSAGAWLEAAHNARRAGDPHAALGRYERAALAAQGLGSLHSIAGAARLWAARVELERGAFASAAQRFEALADSHCDPLLRLSAFDELALLALAQGDPEGAAGWIQAARLGLAGPAASDTDTGRRLRRALAHLRALPELTLAIEERVRGASHAAPHSGADSQLRLLIDSED
jgi:tetratricopeptide (TPR) repeat protein